MLNRRQFLSTTFGSLGMLIISAKPKIFASTGQNFHSASIDFLNKLQQGYLLLTPYNQDPEDFAQNVKTVVPVLTSVVDTYNPLQLVPSSNIKVWQLHSEEFQANESTYQILKISSQLVSPSKFENVSTYHWNLWEKKESVVFTSLGTISLAYTGQNQSIREIYKQGGGILVSPVIEAYSYKGYKGISLTQLSEITSPSTHF